jgi:hypothetical protein
MSTARHVIFGTGAIGLPPTMRCAGAAKRFA